MKRIMIVDDDIQLAEQMKNVLVGQSNEVVAVFSGMEFLRQFEIFKPDLLVIYTNMPNMDGIKILENIELKAKKTQAFEELRILILTSAPKDELPIRKMHFSRIIHYLQKPFRIDSFLDEISLILHGKDYGKDKENDEINSMSFGKKIASAYSDYSRNLPKRDISRAIIKNIPTNTASSGNDFDVIISSIECIQNSLGKVRTQLERIADS